jgi:hypothetical protein
LSFDVYLFRFSPVPAGFDESAATRELWEQVRDGIPAGISGRLHETQKGLEIEIETAASEGHISAKGGAFFLRSLPPGLIEAVYRIARAGDMVLAPAMAPARFVMTDENQLSHLPNAPEWRPPLLVQSGEELRAYLRGGYQEWEAYRQQIIAEAHNASRLSD